MRIKLQLKWFNEEPATPVEVRTQREPQQAAGHKTVNKETRRLILLTGQPRIEK